MEILTPEEESKLEGRFTDRMAAETTRVLREEERVLREEERAQACTRLPRQQQPAQIAIQQRAVAGPGPLGAVRIDIFGDLVEVKEVPEGICLSIVEAGEPRAEGGFASVTLSKPGDMLEVAALLLQAASKW